MNSHDALNTTQTKILLCFMTRFDEEEEEKNAPRSQQISVGLDFSLNGAFNKLFFTSMSTSVP